MNLMICRHGFCLLSIHEYVCVMSSFSGCSFRITEKKKTLNLWPRWKCPMKLERLSFEHFGTARTQIELNWIVNQIVCSVVMFTMKLIFNYNHIRIKSTKSFFLLLINNLTPLVYLQLSTFTPLLLRCNKNPGRRYS